MIYDALSGTPEAAEEPAFFIILVIIVVVLTLGHRLMIRDGRTYIQGFECLRHRRVYLILDGLGRRNGRRRLACCLWWWCRGFLQCRSRVCIQCSYGLQTL